MMRFVLEGGGGGVCITFVGQFISGSLPYLQQTPDGDECHKSSEHQLEGRVLHYSHRRV